MKNKISVATLLLLWIVAIFSACEKLEDLLRFNFKDQTEIVIPSQNLVNTGQYFQFPMPEVQSSSQSAFSNNNTQAKYVKEAKLKELKLTITAPEQKTFSFINEINIWISAPQQEEVLLASKMNIPATAGNVVLMESSNINLKPYLMGDSYQLRTEVKFDELPTQEVRIKADMTYTVTAEIF